MNSQLILLVVSLVAFFAYPFLSRSEVASLETKMDEPEEDDEIADLQLDTESQYIRGKASDSQIEQENEQIKSSASDPAN